MKQENQKPTYLEDLTELLDTIEIVAEETALIISLKTSTEKNENFKVTWDDNHYSAATLRELTAFLDGIINGYIIKNKHIKQGY